MSREGSGGLLKFHSFCFDDFEDRRGDDATGDHIFDALLNSHGNFSELNVSRNDFNVNLHFEGTVINRLYFNGNQFNKNISFSLFSFSELRNEISWIPISQNRLAYYIYIYLIMFLECHSEVSKALVE